MGSDAPDPFRLEPVSFNTPMRHLERSVVIECEDAPSPVVLEISRSNPHLKTRKQALQPEISLFTSESSWPTKHRINLDSTLGDVAATHLRWRPLRAYRLPPGQMRPVREPREMALRYAGVFAAVALTMWFITLLPEDWEPLGLAVSVLVFIWAAVRALSPLWHRGFVHEMGEQRRPLEELLDTRPALQAAERIVEQVRQEYGELLTDLCFRIENPALFDAADPTTAGFTTAMIQWDNAHGATDPADAWELASRVRVAFDAARANAEALGINHVPETQRDDVDRAARIIRQATDPATPEPQRRAALARASEILEDLALYYLPKPQEMDQILGRRTPPALPGRWSPT